MKGPFDDQITSAIDAGKDHKSMTYYWIIETEIGENVNLMIQRATFQELDSFEMSKFKRMSTGIPVFSL